MRACRHCEPCLRRSNPGGGRSPSSGLPRQSRLAMTARFGIVPVRVEGGWSKTSHSRRGTPAQGAPAWTSCHSISGRRPRRSGPPSTPSAAPAPTRTIPAPSCPTPSSSMMPAGRGRSGTTAGSSQSRRGRSSASWAWASGGRARRTTPSSRGSCGCGAACGGTGGGEASGPPCCARCWPSCGNAARPSLPWGQTGRRATPS